MGIWTSSCILEQIRAFIKKRKEKKGELAKTWKAIGSSKSVYLNGLETKSESRRRRSKEDVELN